MKMKQKRNENGTKTTTSEFLLIRILATQTNKNLQMIEHREDSSKFGDFRTKQIVSARPMSVFMKERNDGKVFEKFD